MYLSGQAVDDLNAPYDEENPLMPSPTAFKDQLIAMVDSHLASDVAGQEIAEFVEGLPYEDNFGYRDAFIGLQILRDTKDALDELLADDETFAALLRDERTQLDDETDRIIREEAKQYEDDTGKTGLQDIAHEAAKGFGRTISEREITGSIDEASPEELQASVDDDGIPVQQAEVRLYEDTPESEDKPSNAEGAQATDDVSSDATPSKEQATQSDEVTDGSTEPQTDESPAGEDDPVAIESETEVSAETSEEPSFEQEVSDEENPVATSQDTEAPEDPAMALFNEAPQIIRIDHPSIKGAPEKVFREAKKWLRKHIIAIATGSRTDDSFPRIAPLIAQTDDPEYSITREEVAQLVSGVRRRFALLRFSKGGGGPDLTGLLDRDGGGPGSDDMFDAMSDLNDLMGGLRDAANRKRDEGQTFTPWTDNGDWQEGGSDGDGDWRGGDDDGEGWK